MHGCSWAEHAVARVRALASFFPSSHPPSPQLREHWIDSLWHWAELTPELKASIGLPAALRVELDRMAPSKENRAAWLLLKVQRQARGSADDSLRTGQISVVDTWRR